MRNKINLLTQLVKIWKWNNPKIEETKYIYYKMIQESKYHQVYQNQDQPISYRQMAEDHLFQIEQILKIY